MKIEVKGMVGFSLNDIVSGIQFNVNFSDKINIIEQDSGTGKSFMFDVIDAYCKKMGIPCLLFNHSTLEFKDNLDEHIVGKRVILLDNADLYLDNSFLELLEEQDCTAIISVKSLVGLYTENAGFYEVNYTAGSLVTERL